MSAMSSGDEEGIDEEEMEVQLSLDEFGRIAGTSDCGLDFSSRVWAGSLTGDDKTTVATEQTVAADCDAIFDGCTTFWLPAQQEPRCSLERLARAIFEHHTRGVVFDADTSGCEFWVQVRKPLAVAPAMQIEVLPASAGMIRFHWLVSTTIGFGLLSFFFFRPVSISFSLFFIHPSCFLTSPCLLFFSFSFACFIFNLVYTSFYTSLSFITFLSYFFSTFFYVLYHFCLSFFLHLFSVQGEPHLFSLLL